MAKILKDGQDFVEGHIVETLHLFDDKLVGFEGSTSTTLAIAENASNLATNASNLATTASTKATNALASASTAQTQANNAVARLGGDGDFFDGTASFTTATDTPVAVFATSTGQGISYGSGYFNFSYPGYYLVTFSITGICNSATSGEVYTYFKDSITPNIQGMTFVTQQSGNRNMIANTSVLVDIKSGERWTPYLNLNGCTIVGTANLRVKIKKVI